MKPAYIVALLILSAASTAVPVAMAGDDDQKAHGTIKAEAVTDYIARHENAVILDVRTPLEYGISHIPGAVNINVQDESFANLAAQLDTGKTYIVYCTKNPVGGRSMSALATLQELGFQDLVSLEGGHTAWSEAELPMTEQEN